MFYKFEELPKKLQKIPEPQPVRRAGGLAWRFQKRVKLTGLPPKRISVTITETKNRILAEEYYKQELLNRVNQMQATKTTETPKATTLASIISDYLTELEQQAREGLISFSTFRHYQGTLNALNRFTGELSPKELTPATLENFLTDLALEQGKPMSRATYLKHYQRLRYFLEFCTVERFLFPVNPLEEVRPFSGARAKIKKEKTGRKTHEEREKTAEEVDEFYTLDQINTLRTLAFQGIEQRLFTNFEDEQFHKLLTDALLIEETPDAVREFLKVPPRLNVLTLSVFQFETGTRHSEAAAVDLLSVKLSPDCFSSTTLRALFTVLKNWNTVKAEILRALTTQNSSSHIAQSPYIKPGKPLHGNGFTIFNRFSYKEGKNFPEYLKEIDPPLFSKFEKLPKNRAELLEQVKEELKKLEKEGKQPEKLGEIRIDKTIREGEGSKLVIGTGTKTQNTAYPLPLSSRASIILLVALLNKFLAFERYKVYNVHYFTGYTGRNPLTGTHYKEALRETLQQVNHLGYSLPVLPSHAFRKSFTMYYMLENPDNLAYVSRYLRHKNIQTTLNHYTSLHHGKLNPQIAKMFTSSED